MQSLAVVWAGCQWAFASPKCKGLVRVARDLLLLTALPYVGQCRNPEGLV